MSWKKVYDEYKVEQCKPPPGCADIATIAAEMGVGEDSARTILKDLIKQGRAEAIPGRKLTSTGPTVPCTYYRLVGKPSGRVNVKA
jgi:Mn-dependent DtxR family transcriptional regulator